MRCAILLGNHGSGWFLFVTVLAAVAGCGYRRPSLAQVEAVVTLDGEPVAGADVMLIPVGSGRAARGLADHTGQLAFSTYASGDGVIPGSYKALVSKRELTARGARKLRAMQASLSQADETTSGPEIEFTDGDYRNLLPDRYAGFETSDLSVTIERRTTNIALAMTSASSENEP